jgi:hypothetical protein
MLFILTGDHRRYWWLDMFPISMQETEAWHRKTVLDTHIADEVESLMGCRGERRPSAMTDLMSTFILSATTDSQVHFHRVA